MEGKEIKLQSDIKSHNKVAGVIGGTVAGIIVGVFFGLFLIIIGAVLSLTLIGAIIGIPMIIAGVGMMAIGPFAGMGAGLLGRKAKCPYCDNVLSFGRQKALDCKYCKKRLLVKGKELVLVD